MIIFLVYWQSPLPLKCKFYRAELFVCLFFAVSKQSQQYLECSRYSTNICRMNELAKIEHLVQPPEGKKRPGRKVTSPRSHRKSVPELGPALRSDDPTGQHASRIAMTHAPSALCQNAHFLQTKTHNTQYITSPRFVFSYLRYLYPHYGSVRWTWGHQKQVVKVGYSEVRSLQRNPQITPWPMLPRG